METLWFKICSWLYMSYFLRRCWGFNLVMKFRCGGSAGLSWCCGKWVNVQSVGEERNAYRRTLLWLVQYETRDKCLSFCCKDFLLIFLNCRFMLTCTFNSKVQPLCYDSMAITCDRPGSADTCVTISQTFWGLACAKLRQHAVSSLATKRNRID